MANEVYANDREVSCKKADGKSICAFPDVCMTPPTSPASPAGIPVPYPNTGMSKDTTNGSRTVKITGEEVIKKNVSYYKTSYGDEAGCATPAKKGVITGTIQGKVYFTSWSMDVKIESENVVRHLDLTTHNHACPNPNEAVPWPFTDKQTLAPDSKCGDDKKAKDEACAGKKEPHCPGVLNRPPADLKKQVALSPSKRAADVLAMDATPRPRAQARTSKAAAAATKEANSDECVQKSRCQLKPYAPKKGQPQCCPGQTPHHIPPGACFKGVKKYNRNSALCVCMEGTSQHFGSHGKNHAAIDYLAKEKGIKPGQSCSIANYNKICADAVAAQCGCSAACIEQQLNESLKPTNRNIKHVHSTSTEPLEPELKGALDEALHAPAAPATG